MKLKDIKDGNSLLIDMIVDIYILHPLALFANYWMVKC